MRPLDPGAQGREAAALLVSGEGSRGSEGLRESSLAGLFAAAYGLEDVLLAMLEDIELDCAMLAAALKSGKHRPTHARLAQFAQAIQRKAAVAAELRARLERAD